MSGFQSLWFFVNQILDRFIDVWQTALAEGQSFGAWTPEVRSEFCSPLVQRDCVSESANHWIISCERKRLGSPSTNRIHGVPFSSRVQYFLECRWAWTDQHPRNSIGTSIDPNVCWNALELSHSAAVFVPLYDLKASGARSRCSFGRSPTLNSMPATLSDKN